MRERRSPGQLASQQPPPKQQTCSSSVVLLPERWLYEEEAANMLLFYLHRNYFFPLSIKFGKEKSVLTKLQRKESYDG